MLDAILMFTAVSIGMTVSAAIGWQVGRIMSPRPPELRRIAHLLSQGRPLTELFEAQ
jgi:hypothetical protein